MNVDVSDRHTRLVSVVLDEVICGRSGRLEYGTAYHW